MIRKCSDFGAVASKIPSLILAPRVVCNTLAELHKGGLVLPKDLPLRLTKSTNLRVRSGWNLPGFYQSLAPVGCLELVAELQQKPIAVTAAEGRLHSADLGDADLGSRLADLCADRNTIAEKSTAAYLDLEWLDHLDSNRQSDFGETEPLAVAIVVLVVRLHSPVWATEINSGPKREENWLVVPWLRQRRCLWLSHQMLFAFWERGWLGFPS